MAVEDKELLSAEEVADYLGVGPVTVYRWCREGRLPCLKVARRWRIRREALDEFLKGMERGQTLVSQMNTFFKVPDHVIAIAESQRLLYRLDAAFFQVAEARGAIGVKFYGGERASAEDLRREYKHNGLDVARLEAEGRLRFTEEHDPERGRAEALRTAIDAHKSEGRSLWASFDWAEHVDLETVLGQQEMLSRYVEENRLVVMMAVLSEVVNEWSAATQRRAQFAYRGNIIVSDMRVSLSHTVPLPPS